MHHNSFLNLLYVTASMILSEVQAMFFFNGFDINEKIFFSAAATHCRCSRFFQQFGHHCCNSQQQLRFTFNLLHILGTFLPFFNLSISSMSALLSTSISTQVSTFIQFADSDYQYEFTIKIFSHSLCSWINEAANRHYISTQITDADHQQTF